MIRFLASDVRFSTCCSSVACRFHGVESRCVQSMPTDTSWFIFLKIVSSLRIVLHIKVKHQLWLQGKQTWTIAWRISWTLAIVLSVSCWTLAGTACPKAETGSTSYASMCSTQLCLWMPKTSSQMSDCSCKSFTWKLLQLNHVCFGKPLFCSLFFWF